MHIFFAYIRSKAKANTYPGPLLNSEGKLVETPIEIANEFNCYFSSVFTTENMSNLSQLHEGSALQNSTESQLEDMNITYEQTYKKLKEIRKDKSQGPDELSPGLLANIAEEIVYPVYHMIQNSLDTGIIPDDWKTANITPIHKGGSKHQASNYRPISLMSRPRLPRGDLVW